MYALWSKGTVHHYPTSQRRLDCRVTLYHTLPPGSILEGQHILPFLPKMVLNPERLDARLWGLAAEKTSRVVQPRSAGRKHLDIVKYCRKNTSLISLPSTQTMAEHESRTYYYKKTYLNVHDCVLALKRMFCPHGRIQDRGD